MTTSDERPTLHDFERDPALYGAILEQLAKASKRMKIPLPVLEHLGANHDDPFYIEALMRYAHLLAPLSAPLPEDHYLVPMSPDEDPFNGEALRRASPQGCLVSPFLHGDAYTWRTHASRALIDVTWDERLVMYLHHLTRETSLEAAIAHGLKTGYFPATRREGLEFYTDPAARNRSRTSRVFVPGEFTDVESMGRRVLTLDPEVNGYALSTEDTRHLLKAGDGVLFVKRYLHQPAGGGIPYILQHNPREFVTVPECDTSDLFRKTLKFIPSSGDRPGHTLLHGLSAERTRSGPLLGKILRVHEFANKSADNHQAFEAPDAFQAERGLEGRIDTFLEWCLTHHPAGHFISFPPTNAWPGLTSRFAITYSNPPDRHTEIAIRSVIGPWGKGWTMISFEPLP